MKKQEFNPMRIFTDKLIVIFLFILVILVSGCISESGITGNAHMNNSTQNNGLEVLILDKGEPIPMDACLERNLSDKIILLESKYCGACKAVVPILKELEAEYKSELKSGFIFLDLSEEDDRKIAYEFKIMPKYTPTVLIGCNIHIGAKSKEIYKQAIDDFLNSE
ncbi:MAG: hypothetical protein KAU95_04295 [Candidatus Aenigmarchaeota archaeon]|nr:hypothetical protein [Candidatus Aenigmarchaeota archaeon]